MHPPPRSENFNVGLGFDYHTLFEVHAWLEKASSLID